MAKASTITRDELYTELSRGQQQIITHIDDRLGAVDLSIRGLADKVQTQNGRVGKLEERAAGLERKIDGTGVTVRDVLVALACISGTVAFLKWVVPLLRML
jgi:hypothetical protein